MKKKRIWPPRQGRPGHTRRSFLSHPGARENLKWGQKKFLTIRKRGWVARGEGVPAEECPWPKGTKTIAEGYRRAWLDGWFARNLVLIREGNRKRRLVSCLLAKSSA